MLGWRVSRRPVAIASIGPPGNHENRVEENCCNGGDHYETNDDHVKHDNDDNDNHVNDETNDNDVNDVNDVNDENDDNDDNDDHVNDETNDDC